MTKGTEFEKTNWQAILNEIDLTGREIAKKIGVSESYISYLRLGKRGDAGLNYDVGVRLLALHKQQQLEKRAKDETE